MQRIGDTRATVVTIVGQVVVLASALVPRIVRTLTLYDAAFSNPSSITHLKIIKGGTQTVIASIQFPNLYSHPEEILLPAGHTLECVANTVGTEIDVTWDLA